MACARESQIHNSLLATRDLPRLGKGEEEDRQGLVGAGRLGCLAGKVAPLEEASVRAGEKRGREKDMFTVHIYLKADLTVEFK